MKYSDWVDANERIADDRETLRKLSDEQLVALDVAKQISTAEWEIENAERELKHLRKIAKNLPKVKKELLNINSQLIREADYRWRGRREVQNKLYGYEE